MLGMEPMALCMLGKHATTELQPQPTLLPLNDVTT
jgi:hypothetical protein